MRPGHVSRQGTRIDSSRKFWRRGAVALAVQAVVTVHVAVIRGVHHQRVLLDLLVGHLVEHPPRHLVDHAGRGVVLGVGLAPPVRVGRIVEAGPSVRTAWRHVRQVREAALAVTLHPAVRLAGVRRVGVGEADEQVERPPAVALAEEAHGAVGEGLPGSREPEGRRPGTVAPRQGGTAAPRRPWPVRQAQDQQVTDASGTGRHGLGRSSGGSA